MRLTSVLAMVLAVSACGGEGKKAKNTGGGGGGAQDDVGETFSATIGAAGGSLSTESGRASVSIPAEALDADTEVTIEVEATTGLPNAEDILSAVYALGPSDAEIIGFAKVVLTPIAALPEDARCYVASLVDGAWVEAAHSVEMNGNVAAWVEELSTYAVFCDAPLVFAEVPAACSAPEFTPCGGDIEGVWTFVDVCFDFPTGEGSPFEQPECASATVDYATSFEGSMTFRDDATYTLAAVIGSSSTTNIDDACMTALAPIAPEPGFFCAAMSAEMTDAEEGSVGYCEYAAGHCVCRRNQPIDENIEDGTYLVDGFFAALTPNDEEEEANMLDFCIAGSTGKFHISPEGEGDIHFFAEQQ